MSKVQGVSTAEPSYPSETFSDILVKAEKDILDLNAATDH